jgi:hypothetical protein
VNASDDVLSRAVAALAPPPAPPPVERVWTRVGTAMPSARRPRIGIAIGMAAGLVIAIGAGIAFVSKKVSDLEHEVDRVSGPGAGRDLAVGGSFDAVEPVRVNLAASPEVHLLLDEGARVTRIADREVDQAAGRVRYDVEHLAGTRFVVRAGGVEIVDVGTRFAVDVAPFAGPSTRVLVTVDEGEVRAGDVALRAGRGLAFVDGKPAGAPWALDARPVVGVEAEGPAVAGAPLVVRVTLDNPTDGWLPFPERGGLRAPVWLEVRSPDGAVRPVRVTESMILETGGPGTAIAPRERAVIRVRFDHTFASPGTYRLRAVYRSADAVDAPASPETTVTVR